MMERKRPEMYYLDVARDGQYVLTAENTVYDLGEVQSIKTVQVPTRVPGRFTQSEVISIEKEYGQKIGSFRDLATSYNTHLSKHDGPVSYARYVSEQELPDYIPADVLSNMHNWLQEQPEISAETLGEAAQAMVASEEALQTEQVRCRDCRLDDYACYSSGYSKYVWKYPSIDIMTQNGNQLVPLDIARVLVTSPGALSVNNEYKLGHGDTLEAMCVATLDLGKISDAYIGGDGQNLLKIDKSDSNSGRRIRVVSASWLEDKQQRRNKKRYDEAGFDATKIITELQDRVTYEGGERVELTDYDARWAEVRSVLARLGLVLTWEFGYRGMGDSDAMVYACDAGTLEKRMFATSDLDSRMMVDNTHRKLVQGRELTYKPPVYDD